MMLPFFLICLKIYVYKNEFILSLFFTDKKSKSLLLGNNNVEMTKQNKLTNSYDIEDKKIRS